MNKYTRIAPVLIVFLLSACVMVTPEPLPLDSANNPETPTPQTQPEEEPTKEEPTMTTEAPSGSASTPYVALNLAIQDLAQRLDAPVDKIEVVAVESVSWPTAALGCPQPETAYPEVVTPGMRVQIQFEGVIYEYHSGRDNQSFLCENPVEPVTILPLPLPTAGGVTNPFIAQAVADLATHLGIDASQIEVVRMEEVDWPDSSLGCPQPDMNYMQALVNGTFIELRVDAQSYHYHSGGSRAPFLCTSKNEVLPEDLPPALRGDSND